MNKIEVVLWSYNIKKLTGIIIEIDLNKVDSIDSFIKLIYDWLWCTENLWLNLNAFFDTIFDNEFWVKKPLRLIIENYNQMYYNNIKLRMLISDILLTIISEWKQDYYFIYLKNN